MSKDSTDRASGYRILIVDDDSLSNAILEEYLANLGYGVLCASGGTEGMRLMSEEKPDLVLLDINMPGKDGFQTLEEIKEQPELAGTPVMFLSSYDRPNLKVRGLELGADDYITKPFDKAELVARIKAALRRTERYLQRNSTLDGNLADIGLTELLQTIEMGKKTALIMLPDMDARLIFESGLLVHAGLGDFEGMAAIMRIFFLEEGRFNVRFVQVPAHIERQPYDLLNLLMNTVTYIDGVKKKIEILPEPESRILVTDEMTLLTGGHRLKKGTTIVLKQLIVQLEGELEEIAESLVKLHKKNPFTVDTEHQ